MKQKILLKNLLISAAAALSLAGFARAGVPLDNPPLEATTPVGQGLLGQQYASLTYSYIDFDEVPVHGDNFGAEYNQPLNTGLDAVFAYDWMQTGVVGGSRFKAQSVTAALRAFGGAHGMAKPYVEAGVGYAWQKYAGSDDNSFVWEVTVGAELQVAPATTITPYIQYADAPDLASEGTWNFGAKANYWVDSQWAVTVGVERDDDQNMSYTVGTNFRF